MVLLRNPHLIKHSSVETLESKPNLSKEKNPAAAGPKRMDEEGREEKNKNTRKSMRAKVRAKGANQTTSSRRERNVRKTEEAG